MCLVLLAYQIHPEYPLLVAANRDEFHTRKTEEAHWWPDSPHILAGRDLKADGTWMGVSRNGRFAAVTNVREPHTPDKATCSRGQLPRRYLEEQPTDEQFLKELRQSKSRYQGYNILFGNRTQLFYFSNRTNFATQLSPGIYGLSNARLDTPWPKVTTGKELLSQQLAAHKISSEELLHILTSNSIFADSQLPATGVSLEWERKLSAIRITGEAYGTRSSTALMIDQSGHACFHEKTLAPAAKKDIRISFQIEK